MPKFMSAKFQEEDISHQDLNCLQIQLFSFFRALVFQKYHQKSSLSGTKPELYLTCITGKDTLWHVLPIKTQIRPQGDKKISCSTQLSKKFFLPINIKMPTIVGILTFMTRKNSILGLSEREKC